MLKANNTEKKVLNSSALLHLVIPKMKPNHYWNLGKKIISKQDTSVMHTG
jgi:hypothetical protein